VLRRRLNCVQDLWHGLDRGPPWQAVATTGLFESDADHGPPWRAEVSAGYSNRTFAGLVTLPSSGKAASKTSSDPASPAPIIE
jgi:hypothetical protein